MYLQSALYISEWIVWLFQVKGIFRGGLSTLLRESIGNAVFFSTYELSRHHLHKQLSFSPSASSHHSKVLVDTGIGIVTGGLAGTAVSKDKASFGDQAMVYLVQCTILFWQFWLAVLPLDVAKTVIQTSPDPNYSQNPLQTLYTVCLFNFDSSRSCILAGGSQSSNFFRFTREWAWVDAMLVLARH